jgi:hypothetical protein
MCHLRRSFPLVWLLAVTLLSIWEQRQTSQKVQPYLLRANLEAKVSLLRKTSSTCSTILAEKIIDNCFRTIIYCTQLVLISFFK